MYVNKRTLRSPAKAASIFICLALVCLMVIGMRVLTSAETTENEPRQEAVAQKTDEQTPANEPAPTPTPTPTPEPRAPEAAAGEAAAISDGAIVYEQLSEQRETPAFEPDDKSAGESQQAEEGAAEPPSGPEDAEDSPGQPEAAEEKESEQPIIEDNEADQPADDNGEVNEDPEAPDLAETPPDAQEGGGEEPASKDPQPNEPAEEPEEPCDECEENEPAASEEGSSEEDSSEEGSESEEEGEDATLDWEYPSGWIESGQKYVRGNLPLAGIVKELETQLANEITHLKGVFDIPNAARAKYSNDNLCEIIAVYAVLSGQTNDFPYGVKIQTTDDQHTFAGIYWDMVKLGCRESAGRDDPQYTIEVIKLSAEDIADQYELSEGQRETIAKLTGTSERAKIDIIRNEGILTTISTEEYKRIQERIPAGSSGFRRAVLIAALSIEGKVKYFWGGKSYHVGWDQRWGEMRTVAADGSKTTGSARPMGLDCSGFVNWAFINAYGNKDVRSLIGISSREQWARSYSVKWNEAKPGDLVFYHVPGTVNINHVGIILSAAKSGDYRIVHCSSSNNGVVVTGKKGFKYVRRPYIYGE